MKTTGILLDSLLVRVKAWDTYATLPPATKLRNIKKSRGRWYFEAATVNRGAATIWTVCTTKHDIQKSLGLT